MNQCSVDGCVKSSKIRGWCTTHYSRVLRTGDPGLAEIATKGRRSECTVDGCSRDATSLKMCGLHYQRFSRKGSTEQTFNSGSSHVRWKAREDLTYDAAHDRVKRERGRASTHRCWECGGEASDWAYQHHAEDPLVDELGRPYSDSTADYAPMCRACHHRFDLAHSHRQQGGDHLFIVTLQEAAALSGAPVPTLRYWIKNNGLNVVRPNAKPLMVRYDDVARVQREMRTKAWRSRHADAVRKWSDACIKAA